jgi:hypothetical protein
MIQHIDCFRLTDEARNIFMMVLLKYLLKVIKMLEDGGFNSQRLIKFDEYKTKDHYALIQEEIK